MKRKDRAARAGNNVFAVILVGGKGKRLRPLSTDERPKAFLSVTRDRKTLLKVTADRIRKIIPGRNIFICANRAHAGLVKKDLEGLAKGNLMLEPVSRNTAPAIGAMASILKKKCSDAVMVVLPADQYITDEKRYLECIKRGISFAAGREALVIMALKPTYPSTGFGYIKIKNNRKAVNGVYKAERFVEKPDPERARRFIAEGIYFWNSGSFVFRADAVLQAIEKYAPEIYGRLKRLKRKDMNRKYKDLPDISIDYAIMEKARNIYCVKGTYGWRDVGSFSVLKEVLSMEARKFITKGEKVIKII